MGSEKLKESIEKEIYEALKEKLETGKHDGIRTSLCCIEILGTLNFLTCVSMIESCAEGKGAHPARPAARENLCSMTRSVSNNSDSARAANLDNSYTPSSTSIVTRLVEESMGCLKDGLWENQEKCVKILSALSQTGM